MKDICIEKLLEIYVDNQSCIAFAENERGPGKAKQIEVKYHFVKDLVERKQLFLKYVETLHNSANLFTKPVAKERHKKLVAALGLS